MKYIFDGTEVSIVPMTTEILDSVPPHTYSFEYSKMSGLHVVRIPDIPKVDFKMYGNTVTRVDKAFAAYDRCSPRNTGVLLTGEPGMGKSLFIRLAAERALANGIPVFVVKENLPGVIDFIGKLSCKACIIMDEFEKVFKQEDAEDTGVNSAQDALLSIMDGISGEASKLFIAASNSVKKITKFMLNRPGRFRYHFAFGNPSIDDIREVCIDLLDDRSNTDEICRRLAGKRVNYDALVTIIDELNAGYGLEETLSDLNLECGGYDAVMECILHTDLGVFKQKNILYDFGSEQEYRIDFSGFGLLPSGTTQIGVSFSYEGMQVTSDGKLIPNIDSICVRTKDFNYRQTDLQINVKKLELVPANIGRTYSSFPMIP